MIKYLAALLTVLLTFGGASAQSPGDVLHEGLVSGGVICDYEFEVRDAIENFETPGYVFPAGCGRLMLNTPATVVLIEVVNKDGTEFVLVRYDLQTRRGLWVQYGVWGAPSKPGEPV